jgi:hypothetical protein
MSNRKDLLVEPPAVFEYGSDEEGDEIKCMICLDGAQPLCRVNCCGKLFHQECYDSKVAATL